MRRSHPILPGSSSPQHPSVRYTGHFPSLCGHPSLPVSFLPQPSFRGKAHQAEPCDFRQAAAPGTGEDEAGCFEIDTVVHYGYGPQNDSLWTLSLTNVANGFVYIRPLRAKPQRYMLEALDDIAENTS